MTPLPAGTASRQETLARLRSARGHLDAVIRMVEEDRYCIDVIHQIRAVQGGLDRSRRGLLDEHLRTCLPAAYAQGTYEDTVTELLDTVLGTGVPRAGRGHCHQD
jgi:CsoR family transcriptional regulator, copper-sensing transcriptional repressor